MIKVGIIGMGGMGWYHAARYFQIPEAQLAAIADVRPERLDSKNAVVINIANKAPVPDLSRIERFSSADSLIHEADVDVIDICLPSYLHSTFAIQALQAGRHVLCEKPMALTVEDAGAMIAASHAAGRKLMIAQVIRFWPEYLALKRALADKSYGQLLSLDMYRIGGRPSGWGWRNWFLDPAKSGGSMVDLHIHDVDFVNYLLGSPDWIAASSRSADPASACETIRALFQYHHGPQVSFTAGWSEVQLPFKAGYEAWFEKGFIRYDSNKTPVLAVYTDPERIDEQPVAYEPGDAYLNEIQYFLDCVRDDREPLECLPESAQASLALLGREREAINTRETK